MPTRLVLDTNVVISAVAFPGSIVSWISHGWQSGIIVPVVSAETIAELARVLSYPRFGLNEVERGDVLGLYLTWCEPVAVAERLPVPSCRDPKDQLFLELALAAGVDALVTGDKDLLTLAAQFPIPILSPAAARGRFGA